MCERKGKNTALKILKAASLTLLGLVLVAGVALWCAVRYLTPERLAAMAEDAARGYIDGELSIDRIRLGFRPSFPVLCVEVENLVIVSHAFDSLPGSQRGALPAYADSLVMLDYLSGTLDVKRLLNDNTLDLKDVTIRGLGANVVIARDGKSNYRIFKKMPGDTLTHGKRTMPAFRIDRFALEQPREIRFYNAADSLSASVLLLTDTSVDGGGRPSYRLRLNGSITSPKASLITSLDSIRFGLNGRVYWTPESPGLVAIDDMEMSGAFVKAVVSGEIDFADSPVVRRATATLSPVALTDLLTLLPEKVRRAHGLRAPYLSTDMRIGGTMRLTAPMNLATDTIPSARIDLAVSPASVRYGRSRFDEVALDVTVNTRANQPDSTVVDIHRCVIDGRGTRLEARGWVTRLFSDPAFEADMRGRIDLGNLPPIVRDNIRGYLSGAISTNLRASGRASMLRPEDLHRLRADGRVTVENVYFLSADTSSLVQIGKATVDFDTRRVAPGKPSLGARVRVDTATVFTGGLDLTFGAVSLDARASHAGVDRIAPVDGRLSVGRFNILTVTDTAGARIRDISGRVRVRPLRRDVKVPVLLADLTVGRAAAGTLSDRILLDNTGIHASLYRHPQPRHGAKGRKKHRTDRVYAYISPAAVHRYVYHKRHTGRHIRRVYGDTGADDQELLMWKITPQFRRFLNQWELRGNVRSEKARLLTPVFPLKNDISALDIDFSNDTVAISDITMQAGRSDLTLSGLITDVRRALSWSKELKGNLSLISRTIDVNELSAAVFTGASYVSDRKHGKTRDVRAADDISLETMLDSLSRRGPGKSSPVLIPVNVNARAKLRANNLLYGDVDMSNTACDILMYDGAVSLHDMTATSDAGSLSLSALYSAPRVQDMRFGFGMKLRDFNVAKFVRLVPAIDSITPLLHDFSGMIGADLAATCRIDTGMNIDLTTLDAAISINGDNLRFIDPDKYRMLGKWLGFRHKEDNSIHSLNVGMTVTGGVMRVYPFAFDLDRYRLGIYGSNNLDMDFDYHLSVLKSPLPFRFGITIKGNPRKYKVRFGGAKFNENTVVESADMVDRARVNLVGQIEDVFKRGVRNSRFARLRVAYPEGYDTQSGPGLSKADSLQLVRRGIIAPDMSPADGAHDKKHDKKHDNKHDKKHDNKHDKKQGKRHKRFWLF